MKPKPMTWLSTLLIINTVNANPENIKEQCIDAFNSDQFQTVINTCQQHQVNAPEIQYLVKASKVFSTISQEKIHDIFLDERLGGQGKRRLERNARWLFNVSEEALLSQHIDAFTALEKYDIPDAIFWSAVLFYIDEFSLAEKDGRIKNKSFMQGRAERKDRLYNMRLETYHALIPDNPQVNFLLGLEGVKLQIPNRRDMSDPVKLKAMYHRKPGTLFYSIEDPRYYEYMLLAGNQGFEPALNYIKGVNAWNQRIENLTKQAKQGDLGAMSELGDLAYREGSISQATQWLSKAGDVQSLKSLARIYLREAPNPEQYIHTIRQLVKLNDLDATLTLGDYYACSGDSNKAKEWYEKAQNQGHALAAYALSDLQEFGEPPSGCQKFE